MELHEHLSELLLHLLIGTLVGFVELANDAFPLVASVAIFVYGLHNEHEWFVRVFSMVVLDVTLGRDLAQELHSCLCAVDSLVFDHTLKRVSHDSY